MPAGGTNCRLVPGGQLASAHPYELLENDLDRRGGNPGFADRILLAKFGPAANFARLLIVLALAELLVQAGSFKQFLETPQGRADRLFVVDAHP